MAVRMTGKSTGTTTAEICHHDSGAIIKTTAPKDNGGDGSSFSPTDLCAASLAACATTIMTMYARNSGIELHGVTFDVEKSMAQNPRRIGNISVKYRIDTSCSEEQFAKLINAAKTCPIRMTLSTGVEIEETFTRA